MRDEMEEQHALPKSSDNGQRFLRSTLHADQERVQPSRLGLAQAVEALVLDRIPEEE
jgi:hypothetical protein